MDISKSVNSSSEKNDIINISIILTIALAIGIYLIATTVLIAKDGVSYIEWAQKFSTDPVYVIKGDTCGYPFLIFLSHKFATYKIVTLFSNNTSVYTWIYSAQCITLLCKLLALIPLYFICKGFVGRKLSFWAILILVLLPYPARFGSDALRDWPYILFLATGFLFLLRAARQDTWWMFGIAGLATGLGHLIRPECAQLVIYGVLWLFTGLLLPKRNMSRPKLICALLILLIGFAIPAVPYMKARGKILPKKLKALISSCCRLEQDEIQEPNSDNCNQAYTIMSLLPNIAKAIGRLIERISENLMYFFVPALLLGIYSRLGRKSVGMEIESFFISVFIGFNVIMMVLLHYTYGYISRRHCLPLVVFTVFYVPIGLQISADWLRKKSYKSPLENNKNPQLWFFILLAVGAVICLSKLMTTMRAEKQGYIGASKWLKENTTKEDVVAVPDKRISFYAEREGIVYKGGNIPPTVVYVVKIMKDADKELNLCENAREVHSLWLDKRKKGEKLVIYKLM